MADEGETRDTDVDGEGTVRSGDTASERRDRGISFRLPPIRLPPMFPDRLQVVLPVPGYRHERSLSAGWVLLVSLLFDALDALLALTVSGPVDLARTGGGTMLALLMGGGFGVLYAWEVLAVLVGFPVATAAPSLVVLAASRMVWGKRSQPERET